MAAFRVGISGGTIVRTRRLILALAVCGAASVSFVRADEIKLKDGKKLYGTIVSFDENMFKVKTDFGYVLVEKDKIASIVPSTPVTKAQPEAKAAQKPEAVGKPAKPAPESIPSSAPTSVTPSPAPTNPANASAVPAKANANRKLKDVKTAATPGTPESPAADGATTVAPPLAAAVPVKIVKAAPKEPELPVNREDVQGNLYTNYTHGFRMYKAPSWQLIEEARKALPNAIVAMGTYNESTLLVVGQEKNKAVLESAAAGVDKRLHDVYENYRLITKRTTTVGGLPGIEYRFRGLADEHDWSGTLVVLARGDEIFTVLGMTYADTDLIQIQENVIARAIASLDFTVH